MISKGVLNQRRQNLTSLLTKLTLLDDNLLSHERIANMQRYTLPTPKHMEALYLLIKHNKLRMMYAKHKAFLIGDDLPDTERIFLTKNGEQAQKIVKDLFEKKVLYQDLVKGGKKKRSWEQWYLVRNISIPGNYPMPEPFKSQFLEMMKWEQQPLISGFSIHKEDFIPHTTSPERLMTLLENYLYHDHYSVFSMKDEQEMTRYFQKLSIKELEERVHKLMVKFTFSPEDILTLSSITTIPEKDKNKLEATR